jgi:hypothetical protein
VCLGLACVIRAWRTLEMKEIGGERTFDAGPNASRTETIDLTEYDQSQLMTTITTFPKPSTALGASSPACEG